MDRTDQRESLVAVRPSLLFHRRRSLSIGAWCAPVVSFPPEAEATGSNPAGESVYFNELSQGDGGSGIERSGIATNRSLLGVCSRFKSGDRSLWEGDTRRDESAVC
jgi:hypothetical protein